LKEYEVMKLFWNIVGALLIVEGGVWFLQGLGILGGSVMSGHAQWAIYGGLAIIIGAGMLLYLNRPETP
jgi:hypothetical protein